MLLTVVIARMINNMFVCFAEFVLAFLQNRLDCTFINCYFNGLRSLAVAQLDHTNRPRLVHRSLCAWNRLISVWTQLQSILQCRAKPESSTFESQISVDKKLLSLRFFQTWLILGITIINPDCRIEIILYYIIYPTEPIVAYQYVLSVCRSRASKWTDYSEIRWRPCGCYSSQNTE